MPRYYCAKVSYDEQFDFARKYLCFLMQFQYIKARNKDFRSVSNAWNTCKEIQVGDYLLLAYGSKTYACGKVCTPQFDERGNASNYSVMQDVIDSKKPQYTDGIVYYKDSDAFYEDLCKDNGFNGSWGQRIDVENWLYPCNNGINNYGIQEAALKHVAVGTIFEINKDFFDKKVKELRRIYMQNRLLKDKCLDLLRANKNLVLTGSPGVGKTYLARSLAASLIGCDIKDIDKDSYKDLWNFVQFHPSYDYTDFVEGLRPVSSITNDSTTIGFERRDGIFKAFCKKALENLDKKKNYVFIIDEINRGEISKIFGELFYAIEPNYRGKSGKVCTQYQNLIASNDLFSEGFFIPENVYIIGTMNDIDRSVEAMDFAIRRRFVWQEVKPLDTAKDMGLSQKSIEYMTRLNTAIENTEELGAAFAIGGAYFLQQNDFDIDYNELWLTRLLPLIKEYLRGFDPQGDKLKYIKQCYDGNT